MTVYKERLNKAIDIILSGMSKEIYAKYGDTGDKYEMLTGSMSHLVGILAAQQIQIEDIRKQLNVAIAEIKEQLK